MNTTQKGRAALTLSLCLLSCAAPVRLHAPDAEAHLAQGQARICVVRTHTLAPGTPFVVRDNGRVVGATSFRGHFCYPVDPGEHHLTAEADRHTAEAFLVAQAGRSYYLQLDIDHSTPRIEIVPRWLDPGPGEAAVRGTPGAG